MYTMASSILTFVLLMLSYSDGQGVVFDVVPQNITCPANDLVMFNCSVQEGEILWFVNDTYALGLPLEYQTFFKTISRDNTGNAGEDSTLQFIAIPEADHSQIVCVVSLENGVEYNVTAMLMVEGGNGTVQIKLSLLLGTVGLLLFYFLC